VKRNGPVPTGRCTAGAVRKSCPSNRCFGTIAQAVASNISRKGWKARLSTRRTVWGSGAVASVMSWKMLRARGESSMWKRMMEKITSSAVIGRPSWKRTLSCRRKTYSRPSGLISQLFASSGRGSSVWVNFSRPWNILGAAISVGPWLFTPICSTGGSGCRIVVSVPPRRGATPCAIASDARMRRCVPAPSAVAAIRPRRVMPIVPQPPRPVRGR
jgi:hypothetical protein